MKGTWVDGLKRERERWGAVKMLAITEIMSNKPVIWHLTPKGDGSHRLSTGRYTNKTASFELDNMKQKCTQTVIQRN